MYYGLEAIHNLDFTTVPTDRITERQAQDLNSLLFESVRFDFPERTQAEVESLVDQADAQRTDLHTPIGGDLLRAGQRYARALTVIALKEDKPVAYISTADNAACNRNGVMGRLEIGAKLRSSHFISSRWAWLGMRAVSEALLPPDEVPLTTQITVMDVLGLHALTTKKPDQPVSSYPWSGEDWWKQTLEGWGLSHDGAPTEPIPAFGRTNAPVYQERWTADHVEDVIKNILQKEDARVALSDAEKRHKRT